MERLNVKTYDPVKHDSLIATGKWLVTVKLDGVQVVYKGGVPTSRSGKPLYNLPVMPDGIYECFIDSWETTISATRTKNDGTYEIDPAHLYQLYPSVSNSIHLGLVSDTKHLQDLFRLTRSKGYEGLVLHGPNGQMLKVKDKETYDVPVTSVIEGTGKNKGKMGALMTPKGKVGTGFTDEQRVWWWRWWNGLLETSCGRYPRVSKQGVIDPIIEVECMSLTPKGMFRHPRFVRLREDK